MENFYKYVKSLPPALPEDLQEELLKKFYEAKDETTKYEIRDTLIQHNLRLVAYVVNKLPSHVSHDDMMQIGTIELMHCLDEKYDISKGIKFSSYAIEGIKGKLINEMNNATRVKEASYQVVDHYVIDSSSKNQEKVNIFDIIPAFETFIEDVATYDLVERYLKFIADSNEKFIIEHYLGINGSSKMNKREIAQALGIANNENYYADFKKTLNKFGLYLQNGNQPQINDEKIFIEEYIKNSNNPNEIFILEHYFALNEKEKLTQTQIATALGTRRDTISRIIKKALISIKNEDDSFNDTKNKVEQYIQTSRNQNEIIVLEYFYGLNGREKLSKKDIAKTTNIRYTTVLKIIERALTRIENKDNPLFKKNTRKINKKLIAEYLKTLSNPKQIFILEHYYGLNGKEFMNQQEIAEVLGVSKNNIYRFIKKTVNNISEINEKNI